MTKCDHFFYSLFFIFMTPCIYIVLRTFPYLPNFIVDRHVTQLLFRHLCESVNGKSSHDTILLHWYYEIYWAFYYLLIDDVDKERWYQTLFTVGKKRFTQQQVCSFSFFMIIMYIQPPPQGRILFQKKIIS